MEVLPAHVCPILSIEEIKVCLPWQGYSKQIMLHLECIISTLLLASKEWKKRWETVLALRNWMGGEALLLED